MYGQGEPFSETKQRLSEFTKIKGKQFEKIKFAVISKPQYSKPEYIEDGMALAEFQTHTITLTNLAEEVLWDLMGSRDEIALALDHVNKSRSFWGKTDSIFIR